MSKPVLQYKEGKFPNVPSITLFSRKPLDASTKEIVIAYMRKPELESNWKVLSAPMDIDSFTGEGLGTFFQSYGDDEYSWTDDLTAYVDKYDIELPQEFIEHVLNEVAKEQ